MITRDRAKLNCLRKVTVRNPYLMTNLKEGVKLNFLPSISDRFLRVRNESGLLRKRKGLYRCYFVGKLVQVSVGHDLLTSCGDI